MVPKLRKFCQHRVWAGISRLAILDCHLGAKVEASTFQLILGCLTDAIGPQGIPVRLALLSRFAYMDESETGSCLGFWVAKGHAKLWLQCISPKVKRTLKRMSVQCAARFLVEWALYWARLSWLDVANLTYESTSSGPVRIAFDFVVLSHSTVCNQGCTGSIFRSALSQFDRTMTRM